MWTRKNSIMILMMMSPVGCVFGMNSGMFGMRYGKTFPQTQTPQTQTRTVEGGRVEDCAALFFPAQFPTMMPGTIMIRGLEATEDPDLWLTDFFKKMKQVLAAHPYESAAPMHIITEGSSQGCQCRLKIKDQDSEKSFQIRLSISEDGKPENFEIFYRNGDISRENFNQKYYNDKELTKENFVVLDGVAELYYAVWQSRERGGQ